MIRILFAARKIDRTRSFCILASLAVLLPLALCALFPGQVVRAGTIRVPQDFPSIQSAIHAAQDGDIILVSPGTYNEVLTISGKTIILASEFYTSGVPGLVDQTVIDGGGETVISVAAEVGPETQITGFTIRNGEDGIATRSIINILNNHIINNEDGIDSTSGGGLIKGNTFENNDDDGIDFDKASSGTIEENIIRNNRDDGIEIRLHEYAGPRLAITIRANRIEGNEEDGIQLIDYPGVTDRVFTIEHNLFLGNHMAALGLMDNGDTKEDFRAANIPERIYVYNNTFVDHPYAITGGDNLIALNNIFTGATTLALKNVDNQSIAAYNLFWNNAVDEQGSQIDAGTSLYSDPVLDASYALQPGSPGIDAGAALYVWNGETVINYPAGSYNDASPDLGWRESSAAPPGPTPTGSPSPTPTKSPVPTLTPNPKPVTRTFLMIWR